MPTLTIDNRRIEVPEGTKVIEAAEALGIMIPRFCYHRALGSVGACRVCAVKIVDGTRKGVQMSCMLDVEEGMVVSTDDPEAVAMRRHVIEWLMLHHPHDCPVCDEGGHCLLQDMTVSGGHGLRRYLGNKRTHLDQYLGPRIQHEMNRCIQCYRCVRYYREFSGYRDLGVTGIGNRVYFGREREGTLENPFSGNLIDICPTGVFTDKPARYFGRRWDLQRGPSVCIHCSLGCSVTVGARYREVARVEARYAKAVNGHFICDRGRWGFPYTNEASRPRAARVDGEATTVGEACAAARNRLLHVAETAGSEAVACLGSERAGLETLKAVAGICRANGWADPLFWLERRARENVAAAVSLLGDDLVLSLRELEAADCVLVFGADPLGEAPMAALALRQARRQGAPVFVFDPRPVELPLDFHHVPLAIEDLPECIRSLVGAAGDRETARGADPTVRSFTDQLAEPSVPPPPEAVAALRTSRRPAVVCGTDVTDAAAIGLAADFAALMKAQGRRAGLFYLMPGANGFGAALAGTEAASLEELLPRIEGGEIRALVAVEADPLGLYPDRGRIEAAMRKLDLLVVLDYLDTDSAAAADVFLPSTTVFETGGTWINQEGRIQIVRGAHRGGIPVSQTGGGGHPPRVFMEEVPGGQAAASGQTLTRLSPAEVKGASEWVRLPPDTDKQSGTRAVLPDPSALRFAPERTALSGAAGDEAMLTVIAVDRTFGTEVLSSRSPWLSTEETAPTVWMHPEEAGRVPLSDGDLLEIDAGGGSLVLPVKIVENMARRTLVIPRHRDAAWQRLGATRLRIERDCIRKAQPVGENAPVKESPPR